jgi:hypothetical protein
MIVFMKLRADRRKPCRDKISSTSIKNVNYSSTNNGGIYFKADATDKNKIVGCVVEIDKQ